MKKNKHTHTHTYTLRMKSGDMKPKGNPMRIGELNYCLWSFRSIRTGSAPPRPHVVSLHGSSRISRQSRRPSVDFRRRVLASRKKKEKEKRKEKDKILRNDTETLETRRPHTALRRRQRGRVMSSGLYLGFYCIKKHRRFYQRLFFLLLVFSRLVVAEKAVEKGLDSLEGSIEMLFL